MGLNSDDTYNLLKEFNKYGATIYYLIEQGKMKLEDVTSILFKKSIEQVSLVFPNFIKKISLNDIDLAYCKYEMEFTKVDCLYDIVEKEEKYDHLNGIKEIVNLDTKVHEIIKDNVYHSNLNTRYTGLLLDRIDECNNKSFLSTREAIKAYKEAHKKIDKENKDKLRNNIDNYYIRTITK